MQEKVVTSTPIPRRFKPYPAYKDSGVEWLGKIPTHWDIRWLKQVASVNDEVLAESTDPNFEMSYVDIGGVDQFKGIVNIENYTFETAPSRARRKVRNGDIIASTVRTYLRAITNIEAPESNLIVSTGFAVIRPGSLLGSRYAAHALRASYFLEKIVANSVGVSYPAIDASKISTFPVAFPRLIEQEAIAAFLDRETAKIDALIEKKEQLIELLREKRTALITQTVTKGLDPTVPMKDSGVEWLGKIPVHWEVVPAKRMGALQGGAGFPDAEQGITDEVLPFFKVADLAQAKDEIHISAAPNSISFDTAKRLRAPVFQAKTIVFPKVGAALRLNRRRILTQPACIDNNMMGFVPYKCDYKWAFYWMNSIDMGRLANPGAVPSVNEGQVREVLAPLPPPKEQRSIANFLGEEILRTDEMIERISVAIACLDEYRIALISAAVTGKIDVREA